MLDNADNFKDFFDTSSAGNDMGAALADFIPDGPKGTIIITTRDEYVALELCQYKYPILNKERMNRADASTLFRSICPNFTESDEQHLDELLNELCYLPLAIVHAASYIRREKFITLTKYLQQFRSTKKERRRLLSKQFSKSGRNPSPGNMETALATFTISFKQIEEQSPLAGRLLRVMACINRQGMPIELFRSLKRPDANETIEEALGRMISLSLLNKTKESAVEMHALIHLSAQEFLRDQKELRSAAEITAELLARILPARDIHEKISVSDPTPIRVIMVLLMLRSE